MFTEATPAPRNPRLPGSTLAGTTLTGAPLTGATLPSPRRPVHLPAREHPVMGLLAAGIPLSLLMDLALGPVSAELLAAEPSPIGLRSAHGKQSAERSARR